MDNLYKGFIDSLQRVEVIHNLVDVIVQALAEKQLINDADPSKAQQILVEESKKMAEKEETKKWQ